MSTTTHHSHGDDYAGFGSGDEMIVMFDTEEQAKMDAMYDRVYRAYRTANAFMPEDFTAEEINLLVGLKVDDARYLKG